MVSKKSDQGEQVYANTHIPSFLRLPTFDPFEGSANEIWSRCGLMQVVHDGSFLTARNWSTILSPHDPVLVTDTPESIGMQLPRPQKFEDIEPSETVTVRDIAETAGYGSIVHVIDVEYQEEMEGWTFSDLVDYFEDEDRVMSVLSKSTTYSSSPPGRTTLTNRPTRKAAAQFCNKTRHRVLNQISFEFSHTPLVKAVKSPSFVREVDWIDQAWPRQQTKNYPVVQYYCLTSAAGCYTDFHVDFGGTSVWYHVVSGSKEFCLIPPTAENRQAYENWLCEKDQPHIFLADRVESHQVVKVSLKQSQTMIIPAGWIHAVYTPTDSLVFGGNFLHSMDMELQLETHHIEVRSKVLERFRFPYFIPLQFYAAAWILSKLVRGTIVLPEIKELHVLIDALWKWWNSAADECESDPLLSNRGAAVHAAKSCGLDSVEEFLDVLQNERVRVKREGTRPNPSLQSRLFKDERYQTSTSWELDYKDDRPSTAASYEASPASKDKFRIKLSGNSSRPEPLPSSVQVARTGPREDIASFVEGKEVDQDWRPSQQEVREQPPKRIKLSASSPPKKSKGTSVRARLLKKTRR